MVDRGLDARDRLGLGEWILDVRYEDVRSNALALMRRIRARAGREPRTVAESAMSSRERDHEQGRHGAHTYSLEEFGLDRSQVSAELGEHTRRFSALF